VLESCGLWWATSIQVMDMAMDLRQRCMKSRRTLKIYITKMSMDIKMTMVMKMNTITGK
jgi:hypothetical protein